MNDFTEKTFILGVGAQKTGTTWLYQYLKSRPEVFMSPLKELHFFDSIWCPEKWNGLRSFQKLVETLPPESRLINREMASRLRIFIDRQSIITGGVPAYIDHFASRISLNQTHFGEITPSYSVLPIEGLQQIHGLHPNIKVVFLMRDPVSRFFSAAQAMNEIIHGRRMDELLSINDLVERTRYDITVANLKSLFSSADIFFGFYESLFCDETIQRLCDFLALPFQPAAYHTRFGETQGTVNFPDEDIATVRATLLPVYEFCRNEFGSAVPNSWRI